MPAQIEINLSNKRKTSHCFETWYGISCQLVWNQPKKLMIIFFCTYKGSTKLKTFDEGNVFHLLGGLIYEKLCWQNATNEGFL